MKELDYEFSGDRRLEEGVRAKDEPINLLTFDPKSWSCESNKSISDKGCFESQLEFSVFDRISISDKTICEILLIIQIIDVTCELYLGLLVSGYNFLITCCFTKEFVHSWTQTRLSLSSGFY